MNHLQLAQVVGSFRAHSLLSSLGLCCHPLFVQSPWFYIYAFYIHSRDRKRGSLNLIPLCYPSICRGKARKVTAKQWERVVGGVCSFVDVREETAFCFLLRALSVTGS